MSPNVISIRIEKILYVVIEERSVVLSTIFLKIIHLFGNYLLSTYCILNVLSIQKMKVNNMKKALRCSYGAYIPGDKWDGEVSRGKI